jgi:hypothetical protein
MDFTQIIITLLTLLFGSSGLIVTIFQHRKSREKNSDDIKKITVQLKNINEVQTSIKTEVSNNSAANKKQIKYTLTRLHRECVERGYITRYELECAEEMYSEYKNLGGNSFVDTIMIDLRGLQIRFAHEGAQ